MNPMLAAATVGAILTTPPPPQVAPRIAAFATVAYAAGVPSAGYLLTHRACLTDSPIGTVPPRRYPFDTDLGVAITTHADFPVQVHTWSGFSRRPPPHDPSTRPLPPAYALPSFVVLMRGLNGDPTASSTWPDFAYPDGRNTISDYGRPKPVDVAPPVRSAHSSRIPAVR